MAAQHESLPVVPAPAARRSAGRNLPIAIAVGAALGASVLIPLFTKKAVFVGVVTVAVCYACYEMTTVLREAAGRRVPLVPLVAGTVATYVAAYNRGTQGLTVGVLLTGLALLGWRLLEERGNRPGRVGPPPVVLRGRVTPSGHGDDPVTVALTDAAVDPVPDLVADPVAEPVAGRDGGASPHVAAEVGARVHATTLDPPRGFVRPLYASSTGPDLAAGLWVLGYVVALAGFAVVLTGYPDGARRAIAYIATCVSSDIGGYAAGVLFGKHPLAPRVSPKKTWEGLAGSAIACMVCGGLLLTLTLHAAAWTGLVFGLAVVMSATVGDLAESLVKRDLGVKDMGRLLPGHGGIMDRLDSLLLTAPVAYLLLVAFVAQR